MANVTGYTVKYGTSKNALNKTAGASTNRIVISDLENGTTHYFQVTATNGDWSGTPSSILSATPLAASVPGAPSNLKVETADSALRVSWGKTKDATYYQVFYREQGASEFTAWGGTTTATSTAITNLSNGTVYEVAVKAGNHKGLGPYSAIATGTPAKEGFEMPELPETNRINNDEITSIVMKDPNNVNKSLCPDFTVGDLIDGDPNTYWIAANYWYDSNITYTFRDTHSMNYLLVVPYLSTAYKNRIDNFTVTLKGESGETLATYYRSGVNITGSDYYILTFPETEGVKSVTLSLVEKTGGPRVSISEIAFEHIGVEYGSTSALVQGKPTSTTGAGKANGLFGCGIAHEIGHNMDKLGKAEITNNIYSLALQAWDGGSMHLDTRLTEDGRWTEIFNKVAQGRPGTANNVFVQLGMYWQLHLAYDNAGQPLAFYNAFFKAWKSGEYSGYSYDERVALIASKVADRNLTEFFTRWGMTLSSAVQDILDDYPAEERAVWYLNDASRTHRINSGDAAEGSASVTAAVDGSKVTLSISHTDRENILGYEIRRNGKAIAFTTQDTYVDDLGAANNLTYTYSVMPVDKLGNQGDAAESREILIAYDKTISSDLYTLDRDHDTVTITMKDGSAIPVTGIKVTGTGLTGSYTVRLKADAEAEDWTSAKTGELSGSQMVAYFNKPGAAPSDTRIWTYDAAVLEITGIPEDAQLELLDYPGDRVDFYEDAAVGVLKDDYRYGEDEDQVIPAGTLVILGTYRGDPAYNYVSIEAEYNTTAEAWEDQEVTTITRDMNGYGLMFAEIPADGAVSDTSDGFFIFVPDLDAEADLNAKDGVTDAYPLSIRAVLYRTDKTTSADSQRVTSQILWISFPESGENGSDFPIIELTGNTAEK